MCREAGTLPHLRVCILISELALVVVASAWTLTSLVNLRRRTGAYGLSDALSAGAIGGMIGFAAGAVLCVVSVGAARPAGQLGVLTGRLLAFGGLALLEGAAVGVAMAFALARFTPGPGAQPPEDPTEPPAV